MEPVRLRTTPAWFFVSWLMLGLAVAPVYGQSAGKRGGLPATDPAYKELLHKAQTDGRVPVIVELAVPAAPQDQTSDQAALQRAVIAQMRASLLAHGQSAEPEANDSVRAEPRGYANLPFLALEASHETLTWLIGSPEVASIREDVPVPPLAVPPVFSSVPVSSVQMIGAGDAWAQGYDGAGQTIAIVDTGVDTSHPALQDRVVAEACFSTTSYVSETVCPDGTDEMVGPGAGVSCEASLGGCGHGTMVASVAAGQDDGLAGVAPEATILSVQVFSRFESESYCGTGNAPCVLSWTSDQLAGLDYLYEVARDTTSAIDLAAVNLSLGGWKYTSQSLCDAQNQPMKAIVDSLRSVDVAVVAAAGNNGYSDGIVSPACLSSTISVGATSLGDEIASFSNSAPFLDLLAPGQEVGAAVAGGGYTSSWGTSLAAPHIAGAWAVLKSRTPSASVEEVRDAIQQTGKNVTDGRNGLAMPRVQVDQALFAESLPVELVHFQALADGEDVMLRWETASETNNAGFEVEHATVESSGEICWRQVGFVEGYGTVNEPRHYTHRVPYLAPGRHRFRLRQVDFDGAFAYSPEVEVAVELAATHALAAAYPNPFNPRTQFTLSIAQPQPVTVTVYDALGRRVAVLHNGFLDAGLAHTFTLDATGWPSGMYLYEAAGATFRQARSVMLVK